MVQQRKSSQLSTNESFFETFENKTQNQMTKNIKLQTMKDGEIMSVSEITAMNIIYSTHLAVHSNQPTHKILNSYGICSQPTET